MRFRAILLLAVAVITAGRGIAQTPTLNITNCVRPEGGECKAPFAREAYPQEFVRYLFEESLAEFKLRATQKFRVRYVQPVTYRFDLGDKTVPYDAVRHTRRTIFGRRYDGLVPVLVPEGEEQIVALAGWIPEKDWSAKLFVMGWLTIWNSQLVEPFPLVCGDKYTVRATCKRENTVEGMVAAVVANTRYHTAQRTLKR